MGTYKQLNGSKQSFYLFIFFFNGIILFLDQLVNHVDNAKEHSNR